MFLKLIFALVAVVICFATDLPPFVKKCRYGDVQCIAKSATALLRNHPAELNKLGFTEFDPFSLDKYTLDESRDITFDMKATLTNNFFYGFSQATVGNARGWTKDAATSKFELYGNIPFLNFTGNYNAEGSVISLPLQGEGQYVLTLNDVTFQLKFKPIVEIRDGKQYLKIKKFKMIIYPDKCYIKMTNLFNGNEELGNSLNEVVNKNWRLVWNEVAPVIYDLNEAFGLTTLQQFFNRFAYEDIFLSDE